MVERLARRPATVTELAEPMEMSLTAVTQHLRILEASGLVVTYKQGRTRHCRLRFEAMDRMGKWIQQRREQWERRLDVLGELLEEDEKTSRSKRQ